MSASKPSKIRNLDTKKGSFIGKGSCYAKPAINRPPQAAGMMQLDLPTDKKETRDNSDHQSQADDIHSKVSDYLRKRNSYLGSNDQEEPKMKSFAPSEVDRAANYERQSNQ